MEPFVFGIPLVARAAAQDWPIVEHLFALTLRSVLAQIDGNFRVILASHDLPAAWQWVAHDCRFRAVRADWPTEPPTAANDDGGRKKWLIKNAVREMGGGLLMFLDADDWVARDLVRVARRVICPDDLGAIIADGIALDYESLRYATFPISGAFEGPFHGLCGSSTIARIVSDSTDPARLDPHAALGSHHEWEARAAAASLPLARLPARGLYMIGTGQNHSEGEGPFAEWRSHVTQLVRSQGTQLSEGLADMFGQHADELSSRPTKRRKR